MIISLDYDETYTRDPIFWAKVVGLATERGHTVICVTARDERYPIDPVREPPLPANMVVIYAGSRWKKSAAFDAGFPVHVWIDDMPGMIEPSRILQFDDEPAQPTGE